MNLYQSLKRKINPFFLIAISFLIVLIIGSLILYSPISLNEGVSVSYIDSLFTCTTSLCVTGLVSIKEGIAETYNLFGKIVIGTLIQIGGLGVMTFFTLFIVVLKRRMNIKEQYLIKESWNLSSVQSIRKIFLYILLATFIFELLGAILSFFSFFFIHKMPLDAAIGYSIFHSVSSFNNAGIDLFGTTSLINFSTDHYLLFVTTLLIIFGGIGYFVIVEVVLKKFNFKKLSLHSKVTISYTLFLILFGTFIVYIVEYFNDGSILNLMDAYFISVSSRTAGFTSVDLYTLRHASLIVVMILMFIGASSGGSGGGVKTTTFAMFVIYLRSLISNKTPHIYKRTIRDEVIKKALILILLGFSLFILGFILIASIEGNHIYVVDGEKVSVIQDGCLIFTSIDYAFDCMSAFATVGLTTGVTPYLHTYSKIILIILMYVGRVGPLTISVMFKTKKEPLYRYVSEDVNVG